ncbi:hypothetical protein MFRU_017g00450 [Monilinia fructicola]|nr:hypothetical protein MFRU_017g00450 [Monilinia fructicola]
MALPNGQRGFNAFNDMMRPGARVSEKVRLMEEYIEKVSDFLKGCEVESGKVTIAKHQWDKFQKITAPYESELHQTEVAIERLEEARNNREAHDVDGRQLLDEASAAKIKDILAREQQDAASMVGEAYALILLNDKSLEHIRSLSPSTKRLLHNAELLPLRKRIEELEDELKTVVQVPATLPDANIISQLRDELKREKDKNEKLYEKNKELQTQKLRLENEIRLHKIEAGKNLSSWNESKVEVSRLKSSINSKVTELNLEIAKVNDLRKRFKNSVDEQKSKDAELGSLKKSHTDLKTQSQPHEKFLYFCITLMLGIPDDAEIPWYDIFENISSNIAYYKIFKLDLNSPHQLWIVESPITSEGDDDISQSSNDEMTSPIGLALKLFYQLRSKPSRVEEPQTLRLMSQLASKLIKVDQLCVTQLAISVFYEFHSQSRVENHQNGGPSFLHGLAGLSTMTMVHHIAMSYPELDEQFSTESYISDTERAINRSYPDLRRFCQVLPHLTDKKIDKVIDILATRFGDNLIHYPRHSPHIIRGELNLDTIGLTLIDMENKEWVMVIEHKSSGKPNSINIMSKSLFRLSREHNNLVNYSYCIKQCSKFSNLIFHHGINDKEASWWWLLTTTPGQARDLDPEEERELAEILQGLEDLSEKPGSSMV